MNFQNIRFSAVALAGTMFLATPLSATSQSIDTLLADRFPIGEKIDLIGGFSTDTPKDPGKKLYSSIRFEGDWLVSCEVSTGRMVQYANFIDDSRMQILGTVAKHTTFGMELEKGCELQLTESQ